jgi:hypothetical protein
MGFREKGMGRPGLKTSAADTRVFGVSRVSCCGHKRHNFVRACAAPSLTSAKDTPRQPAAQPIELSKD